MASQAPLSEGYTSHHHRACYTMSLHDHSGLAMCSQDTKKGKGKPRQEARQQTQQQRSVEERYMEKAEARATGELPPDEAFEKRLEAMRRRAAAATKVL